jgi:signal transduction histidine kinase
VFPQRLLSAKPLFKMAELAPWWPVPVIVLMGVTMILCVRRLWTGKIKLALIGLFVGEHVLLWAILRGRVCLETAIVLHLLLLVCSTVVVLVVWHEASPARQKRREALAARDAVESALSAERARIARELHDTVGHGLTMISLSARQGARGKADEGLRSIDNTAHHAMQEVSRVLRQLSIGGDHGHGSGGRKRQLGQVVEGVVGSMERLGLPIRLTAHDAEIELLEPLCRVIERVVRESLLNIIKHMPSASAAVTVLVGDEIELTVRGDEGRAPVRPLRADHPPLISSGRGMKGIEHELNIYGGGLSLTIGADFSLVEVRIPLVLYGHARSGRSSGSSVACLDGRVGGQDHAVKAG